MSDRLLGVAAIIFAGTMFIFGWGIQAPFSYEPVGPRTFPLIIATVITLCGLWLVIKNENRAESLPRAVWTRVWLMVIVGFAYAFLFQVLGFIVATTLMTVAVGRLFNGKWLSCIIAGIIMGLLFYFLFDYGLDVVLPRGYFMGDY